MQKALASGRDRPPVPLIVHHNSHVFARRGLTPAARVAALRAMARDLEAAGATALALPSASAHVYAPELSGATDLPFLDMLQAASVATAPAQRIGVLTSATVRRAGLLQAYLPATVVYPDDETALETLFEAQAAGADPDVLATRLAQIVLPLASATDRILIASTRLSRLAPLLPAGIDWVDALDSLVSRVIVHAQTPVSTGKPIRADQ